MVILVIFSIQMSTILDHWTILKVYDYFQVYIHTKGRMLLFLEKFIGLNYITTTHLSVTLSLSSTQPARRVCMTRWNINSITTPALVISSPDQLLGNNDVKGSVSLRRSPTKLCKTQCPADDCGNPGNNRVVWQSQTLKDILDSHVIKLTTPKLVVNFISRNDNSLKTK